VEEKDLDQKVGWLIISWPWEESGMWTSGKEPPLRKIEFPQGMALRAVLDQKPWCPQNEKDKKTK
jgi:hypothetical protein